MTTALDDLVEALAAARESVFRFEGHQDYPDDELWHAHQRGEWWEQSDDLTEWCALVSATVDRGAHWIRARLVIDPWTPYTHWEIEQHFPHNLTAGEDIRLVQGVEPWPVSDFWMVDDRAWWLRYGPDGTMTVTEVTVRDLPDLQTWRDLALTRAVPMAVPAA